MKSGAKHVICVQNQKEVLDQAAIDFTATFYRSIFGNKQASVCDAFKAAKRDVEFKHKSKEADIFKMFTAEEIVELELVQMEEVKPHHCVASLIKPETGELNCLSDHISYKHITAKLKDLKFRDKEMWELIENVMSGERLIALLGLPGIGKSSIARNALHFMVERKFFTGGVILVQLKNVKDIYTFTKQI